MIPGRGAIQISVRQVDAGAASETHDHVAVEEPLEIRISYDASGKRESQSVSVTMRTPGADYELAAGFLFSEGLISRGDDIHQITYCVGGDKTKQEYNVVSVSLRPGVAFDPARINRNFYATSSCGLCGKATLDAIRAMLPVRSPLPVKRGGAGGGVSVSASVISSLPQKLSGEQTVFEKTGGLHAAGLFDASGNLLGLKEDVGRHNAVDKVIGEQVLAGKVPLADRILLVSSRASFEIMQKAVLAGIPIVAAVGAPSSLAVSVAQEFGVTLLGFVRGERFNIYAGAERIAV
jgi:FdhD protein